MLHAGATSFCCNILKCTLVHHLQLPHPSRHEQVHTTSDNQEQNERGLISRRIPRFSFFYVVNWLVSTRPQLGTHQISSQTLVERLTPAYIPHSLKFPMKLQINI